MRVKRIRVLSALILWGMLAGPLSAQKAEVRLHEGWQARRANEVMVDGTVISSPGFNLSGWMKTTVPGTVLTTLLNNGVFPDPFFGLNNELIPDISDTGAAFYTFWFHNTFALPEWKAGQEVWLHFRGINYAAEVFLNGHRISYDTHRGMFLRLKYRITPFLNAGGENHLAVLVYPPNPAGVANGGQGGDGSIARSVTQQYTPGWDWVCPVRDRNTGLWDQVTLETTGAVDLRHPFIKTRVPGVRTPGPKQAPAFLQISADLANTSPGAIQGHLIAGIDGREWTVPVTLPAGQETSVALPEIKIENPRLWWPNGLGEPHLYALSLRFETKEGISDTEEIRFGIRENRSYFDEKTGGRVFQVNGQKIFIKGGNWISSDLLLRHTPERYAAEVRMHSLMNMNMIRIWGGSITERPEFYEACDQYGILVWQDLWVTGDCNGRWYDPMKKESQARRQAYPDDHSLFITSVIDQVRMLRNHPSLYLWCGGNEFPPASDIDTLLARDIFPRYDGTRLYLNESTSPELLRNTIGGSGDGPYGIQDPVRFFNTLSYPFNPEIGSVGMPNAETMRRMMREQDLQPPVKNQINPVWRYHKYLPYGATIDHFGEVKGIDDFCRKAQVVNYEQYRALQEGFNAGMWSTYTGMLVWKNQNPWTALRGQFYDVYLDQNGGFYGYKHGAKPLHAQLNLHDSTVCIVNQTLSPAIDLTAEAHLFNLRGQPQGSVKFPVSVPANTTRIAGKSVWDHIPQGFYFIRLLLKDPKGQTIDENLYWLTHQPSDFRELETLQPATLQLSTESGKSGQTWLHIKNNGKETAFFIRVKVVDKNSGGLASPVFLEDNYLTLFPGEEKKLEMDLSHLPAAIKTGTLVLQAEAWNSPLQQTPLF